MNDSHPPRNTRISLRTLMLAITFFAMALVIWQLNAEIRPLRLEVRKLRNETGQLTIDDPDSIHAIQLETDYPLAWKWRIYIPEGQTTKLCHRAHRVARNGFPKSGVHRRSLTGPAEVVVTVKIDKQPDNKWRTNIILDGGTSHILIPDDATQWLDAGSSGSQFSGVGRAVAVAEGDNPLVLLRKRVFYETSGQIPPQGAPTETDGLLVWIEH